MADKTPNIREFLDTMDPNNYVIGIVHVPPGCDAKDLLVSTPKKTLNKYFKKLAKHPERKVRKILPTSKDSRIFELISEGPTSRILMPFVGKSSKGGHCLRLLSIHRLQMLLTNKKEDDSEDADDDQPVHEEQPKGISSKKRPEPQDFSFSKDIQPIKRRKTLK